LGEGKHAIRPTVTTDLAEARDRWAEWTGGGELGDDVYVLGTPFTDSVVLPRAALLELMDKLDRLRRGESLPDREPARTPEEPAPEHRPAGPGDEEEGIRAVLSELEASAVELDALAPAEQTGGPDAATASAKRRVLLVSLDAAGVLADDEETRRRLEAWNLPTLLQYHLAATWLLHYYDSDERRERIAGGARRPVLGGPVSIDWFRLGSPPQEGLEPFEWLTYCESVFVQHDSFPGGSGEFAVRHGGPWYRFLWRKDDGVTPALLRVEPA
jgi:hypothetical protein